MTDQFNYRQFDYDFNLIPNRWIRERERAHDTAAIGLSPGHPAWGLLYYAVLAYLRPDEFNTILEIGTNHGASTIILAQALIDSGREGTVITIEQSPILAEIAQAHFAKADVDCRILSVVGDSKEILPGITNSIRIAFIDGSHDCEDVVTDFENVMNILQPGGLVIMDNTTMGGVRDALTKMRQSYSGNFIEFPFVSWSPPGFVFWKL